MLVLGIESSCDETAAAVVDHTGRVHSDVVHSQVTLHARYGGIVPELASRDHLRNIAPVITEALRRASLTIQDLDGIAVTQRPGLVGALLVGVQAAKGIAWAAGIPLVGVDHLIGHLLAVYLQRSEAPIDTPAFPFVCLLASGGHTAIYTVASPHPEDITELGATRDDAAGEAFDKVAKLLDLGYPGGPQIDRLAATGDASRYRFTLPMAARSSLEFSFSGIKTQVAQHIDRNGKPETEGDLADLCAGFQRTAVTSLTRKLLAAATVQGVRDVVIGGGVAANRELRETVLAEARRRDMRAFLPSLASCTDNAAMIAYAGLKALERGEVHSWNLAATSRTVLARATRKGRGAR
jgi:N6-L-threonylcarbamoyladenine synthase